jgi:hypothetical protein
MHSLTPHLVPTSRTLDHDGASLKRSIALFGVCAVTLTLVIGGTLSSVASAASKPAAHVARTDSAGTVWLCRPGLADDPCAGDLTTTSITATNGRSIQRAKATGSKRFDCFYLYPTASGEQTVNSDLVVQPAEVALAMSQTGRLSQVCDVWAPMYRQITVHALFGGGGTSPDASEIAYDSVLSAWKDFIAHYDNGRPIILISHSQGSVEMIKLVQSEIDNSPKIRKRIVVAIIAGGNVTVPDGKEVGSTFQHLPLCTTSHQTGCVIAYSSFPTVPPANSMFGRAGLGISLNEGQTVTTGVHVACVNPAAIGGGTAELSFYTPVAAVQPLPAQAIPAPTVTTPWVTYPNMFSATCTSADGATWLQVTHNAPTGDVRPVPPEPLGVTFGYHLDDLNLPAGNLVKDVRTEEASYRG